jgi:hypothetical protein
MDFAWEAVKAYSAIDKNQPGAFEMDEIKIPIETDPEKGLEFWQRWLIEGLAQAQELAQQTMIGNINP